MVLILLTLTATLRHNYIHIINFRLLTIYFTPMYNSNAYLDWDIKDRK